jgi:hypothetical protein
MASGATSGLGCNAGGERLDEFLIPGAVGSDGLLFYERSPADRAAPIDGFWVRVMGHNLSAACPVYAGYSNSHPSPLFADMARRWSGWPGELAWESLEGEFTLRCRHDRLGHIAIRAELRSGHMPDDWRVVATVMAEAGQLADLARRAALFFVQPE